MRVDPDPTPTSTLRSCPRIVVLNRTWARMGLVPMPRSPLPQPPMAPGGRRTVRRLERPAQGRYPGGVCAGLADHLGLNVQHIRLAFILASPGGAGVAAYIFLWALTPQSLATEMAPSTPTRWRRRDRSTSPCATSPWGSGCSWWADPLRPVQHGSTCLGVLLPLLTVAGGAVIAWSRTGRCTTRQVAGARRPGATSHLARLGIGIVLATIGVVVLATQGRGLAGLWDVGIAAVAVLAGAALIAAPWAVRLWGDLRVEQAERIRETERADIAAHLHDSVLQTLALIQRKAGDPAEVVRLARAQERELRGWLYAGPLGSQASLASAVTEVAHEVEDVHGIPIDLVVTGDRPPRRRRAALVRALREALLNAVRHGAPPVSAYVEVGPDRVEAFVRDHGPGFLTSTRWRPDRLGGARVDPGPHVAARRLGVAAPARARHRGHPRAPPRAPTPRPERRAPDSSSLTAKARHSIDAAPITRAPMQPTPIRARPGRRPPHVPVRSQGRVRRVDGDRRRGTPTSTSHRVGGGPDADPTSSCSTCTCPGPRHGGSDVITGSRGVTTGSGEPVRFLALSVSDAAEDVIAVIRAGARGYVTKTISGPDLTSAIRRVSDGDAVFSPRLAASSWTRLVPPPVRSP